MVSDRSDSNISTSGTSPSTNPVVVDVMEMVIIVVSSVSYSLESIISTSGSSPSTSPDVVDVTELVIIVVDSVRMAGHRLEAGPQIAANCLELPSPTEKDFQMLAFLQG